MLRIGETGKEYITEDAELDIKAAESCCPNFKTFYARFKDRPSVGPGPVQDSLSPSPSTSVASRNVVGDKPEDADTPEIEAVLTLGEWSPGSYHAPGIDTRWCLWTCKNVASIRFPPIWISSSHPSPHLTIIFLPKATFSWCCSKPSWGLKRTDYVLEGGQSQERWHEEQS